METGKKPSSHGKKVGQGSVSANKTEQVNTGGQQVGSGNRPASGGQAGRPAGGQSSGRGVRRAAGGGSSLLLIVLAIVLLRGCGSFGSSGGYTDGATAQTTVTQAPVVTQTPTPAPSIEPSTAQSAAAQPAAGRAKRYTPKAGDSVTVMVYMCGTDLESSYGMATSDLQEMVSATIGSNVNVLVETGGCKMWKNRIVSNSSNQIYKVETGGVRLVKDLGQRRSMVEPATLTEFIQFCHTTYPADRNILIFWDHGGGSITGYGYDETQSRSAGSMDLAEISQALSSAGCTFDWIGFDACLMATLETAVVCENYADYMIASEESEPGTGWYYTNWLTMLSQNTAIDTVTLGTKLVDDFVSNSRSASANAQVTLSLVDLAELAGAVPPALTNFATELSSMIGGGEYSAVSTARSGARQFAQSSRINQIDLADFANRLNTDGARALIQALSRCIVYNNSTISRAYGLSIYFPYETTSTVSTAVSTYRKVGMDAAYTKAISSFASLATSGQLGSAAGSYGSSVDMSSLLGSLMGGGASSSYSGNSSYGANSLLGALMGGYSNSSGQSSAGYSVGADSMMQLISALAGGGRSIPGMEWLDTDVIAENAEYVASHYIDPGELVVTIRPDGSRVLTLSAEQWDIIDRLELNVYVNDGEGFLDLGLDNVFDWADDTSVLLDWDGTWMTLNGRLVAFYVDSSDEDVTTGHIPARLTQTLPAEYPLAGTGGTSSQGVTVTQFVYLDVVFDAANPDGAIVGARPMYADGETDGVAKGDIQIGSGDVLEFLCDYYTLDGEFDSAWRLGDPLTVGADGLKLEYLALDNDSYSVTWRITDMYGNHYWLPAWTV